MDLKPVISEAIVYEDSAFVNRTATVQLEKGLTTVVFPEIVPSFDDASLRVTGRGSAVVKILGAEIKEKFLEENAAETVKKLQKQLEALTDEKGKLEDSVKISLAEKDFLDSIRLFAKGEPAKAVLMQMPDAKQLEATYGFLDEKLNEIFSGMMSSQIKIREINKKIAALNSELQSVSGSETQKKSKKFVEVSLEVLKPGDFTINLAFLVYGASWYPVYDARASIVDGKVELACYGMVNQTTGESWDAVSLSLSTARPTVGGTMPEVSSWTISEYIPPSPVGGYAKKAMYLEEGSMQKLASPREFEPQEEMVDKEFAAEEEVTQVENRGTATVYKIVKKSSVVSDGNYHKMPISLQGMETKFEYSAYPMVSLDAYMRGKVKNSNELQLLAGQVNVFIEGDFAGVSTIKNIGPGEEFDLDLGTDENVKIKRELVEKRLDEMIIPGIKSLTKRLNFKYKLSVENYKTKKITVNLFEPMPVSESDRIKVKINPPSIQPKENDWENKKGVCRWELNLAPKQKQEIFYGFTVEYPKDMKLDGI